MRCPKCKYIFSEEIKVCPKCGTDMGGILEKLGYFPPSASKPFLTKEDFREQGDFSLSDLSESTEKKEIEFSYELDNE